MRQTAKTGHRRIRVIALTLLALSGAPVSAATTAIINVNVLRMLSSDVVPAQTVLVKDGVIEQIGDVDRTRIPDDAFVVDGTDRFLMPGLAEMHAHVPPATSDSLDRNFNLFVVNGVTSIRGMLGDPSHLALRQRIITGEVFGPRLITSGPSLNGRTVEGPQDARRQVREQAEAGYDFIKIHPGLSSDEFFALAQTANEIGIPFAGHVPVAAGLAAALSQKMATIDHLDGYFVAMLPPDSPGSGGYGGFFDVMLAADLDAEEIDRVAEMTATAGVWNVPTQTLVEHRISDAVTTELMNWPEMRYMPRTTVQRWAEIREKTLANSGFDPETAARAIKLRRQLIRALHDAGAELLLGSDAPQVFNVPGFSLHRELKVLVAAGLTPYEALRTGTVAAAEFLGTNAGVIAVGKDADLLLLDANPFEDIENSQRIHGVMLRGQWLSRRALDERLERFVGH